MSEDAKFEYMVRTCPIEDTKELQELLNEMSSQGWELYSLHEAEGEDGYQYNCIFSRESLGIYKNEEGEIAELGHFNTRMEKLFHYRHNPYEQAKVIQKNLRENHDRIENIKELLDSNSTEIDREALNNEISEKLSEKKELKARFAEAVSPVNMYERLGQDILTVVVSEELLDIIDNKKSGELIIESIRLRQKLADNLGYVLPNIKFVISDSVAENQYSINVRKLRALSGFAYNGYRLFYYGQANIKRKPKNAIEGIDPLRGKKVFWIEESETRNYWDKGLSPAQVIINQLEFVALKYAEEIVSYKDVLNYISLLGEENLFIAEELLQGAFSIGDLRPVIARLIREKVSVKDIVFVFEKLNDLMKHQYDQEKLLTNLRLLLSKNICGDAADLNNIIYAIVASPEQTVALRKSVNKKSGGKYFLNNNVVKEFLKQACESYEKYNHLKNSENQYENIAMIVHPELRVAVINLIENSLFDLKVISEDEISEEFSIEVI